MPFGKHKNKNVNALDAHYCIFLLERWDADRDRLYPRLRAELEERAYGFRSERQKEIDRLEHELMLSEMANRNLKQENYDLTILCLKLKKMLKL